MSPLEPFIVNFICDVALRRDFFPGKLSENSENSEMTIKGTNESHSSSSVLEIGSQLCKR